jgi:hypothetical protein
MAYISGSSHVTTAYSVSVLSCHPLLILIPCAAVAIETSIVVAPMRSALRLPSMVLSLCGHL